VAPAGSVIRELDGNNNVLKEYIRGLDLGGGIGGIIYQKKGSDYYYYHYNHKGDVVALTDGSAKLAAYYEYDAWANTMTTRIRVKKTGVENPYRYSTKEWDEKSGLYYFGARYYSPEIARWTQRDPAGIVDGLNLYASLSNSPPNVLDRWGNQPIPYDKIGTFLVAMEPNAYVDKRGRRVRWWGRTHASISFGLSKEAKECCKGVEMLQAARTTGDPFRNPRWHFDDRWVANVPGSGHMDDWPGVAPLQIDRTFRQLFGVCAVCTSGAWSGLVLGCFTWGHDVVGGVVSSAWPTSGDYQPGAPSFQWMQVMWFRLPPLPRARF